MPTLRIGIVAPCSNVPAVEFGDGQRHLRSLGFDLRIHPQVSQYHYTFAGADRDRAKAFYEFAADPSLDIVWSARGGYGATRLCRLLDELTLQHGKPPKKLLIGYSDVTVLHEYVRTRWGWSTLHCPMPAASNFARLSSGEWDHILALVQGKRIDYPATDVALKPLTPAPLKPVRAELVGGNLSLWSAMTGTRYGPTPGKGRFVFLEDVDEPFYRLDRMMVQIADAGLLDGAAALILGDFTNCKDDPSTCLAPCDSPEALQAALANPAKATRIPLRKTHTFEEAVEETFIAVARRLGIPLLQGLPVGHGPNFHPLPLGATYELTPDYRLKLIDWDWLKD